MSIKDIPVPMFSDMDDVRDLFREVGQEKMMRIGQALVDAIFALIVADKAEATIDEWKTMTAVMTHVIASIPMPAARMGIIQALVVMDQEGYTPENIGVID